MKNLEKQEAELERLKQIIAQSAGLVKLVCGVCNGAAHALALEAHDQLRGLPCARRQIKGGRTVWQSFERALDCYQDYANRLLYTDGNWFFHLAYMDEATRKRYGNITDEDYFEMWISMGAAIYDEHRALATCLQNKWRLYLEAQGVKDSSAKAWCITAMIGFGIASMAYQYSVKQAAALLPNVRFSAFERIFKSFDLSTVGRMWMSALDDLDRRALLLAQDAIDKDAGVKNIKVSVEQLQDAWLSDESLAEAMRLSVTDFEEVFRTKGEQKKRLREIDELEEALKAESSRACKK